MKLFLLVLKSATVAFALTPRYAAPSFDIQNKLIGRIEGRGRPGREDLSFRPPPTLEDPHPHENPRVISVHEIANILPGYIHPKEQSLQETTGDKAPASGETVLSKELENLPLLAKLYLGVDDEEIARAMKSGGWLDAAVKGKEYTIPGTSYEEMYKRRRAISKDDYLKAQKAVGLPAEIPSTWDADKGWWQGKAADYQDHAAVRRYALTMYLRKTILESPQLLRLGIVDNTGNGRMPFRSIKKVRAAGRTISDILPARPVNGGPLGHTLLEGSSSTKSHDSPSLSRRQGPISKITDQMNRATTDSKKDPEELSSEYQTYLAAFRTAQSNVSEIITPFLDTMLNGTNSSIVYDAAWSIYSDLTGTSPMIVGPFMYGMHILDWIEDQMFGKGPNVTAMSESDKFAMDEVLATHSVLLDLYYYAWNNSMAALSKTTLLEDMATLAQYLSTNDTSALGTYANYTSPAYDSRFFTIHNATVLPDGAYGPLSS